MGKPAKGRLAAWGRAFIPRYISNGLMLAFYKKAARFSRIPEHKVEEHEKENRRLLAGEGSPLRQGEYVENQAEWGAVRFGLSKRSNMAYSGCEILATYNAKLALGERMSVQDMAGLIARYERKGAALNGAIGTSPREIAAYFEESGYQVRMTDSQDLDVVEETGRKSDTVIVTAYNNRNDITGEIHTISVTKDREGKYTLHNVYAYDRSRRCYAAKGRYSTLREAIGNMASAPAVICIIGIRK